MTTLTGLNTTQHMYSDGMERTLLFFTYATVDGEIKVLHILKPFEYIGEECIMRILNCGYICGREKVEKGPICNDL